jgi:hypothetical protein
MFWRSATLLIVAVLLCSCETAKNGLDYSGMMRKVGPPKPGQSRIVVLQEKTSGLGLSYCACDVKLDGSPTSPLKPGTYLYADRPAGRHQLSATETLFPGETKRDITTESGRTYFFLARASERHNTVTGMAVVGGLAGAVVASVATSGSDSSGPVDFFPLDKTAARSTIAELQLAE